MTKTIKIFFIVCAFWSLIFAQLPQKEIKIIAVRVEFVEDNDEATTGNGKFGSIYTKYKDSTKILDPLPFNKQYFEAHLAFAVNYYNYITNGQLKINYTLLDDIITTDKKMREYSPPVKSNNFSPMVNLASEVWEKVASKGINLGEYDVFLIFHAGVGRDVEIPGSLGYSRDLPSVFLSHKIISNTLNDKYFPLNKSGKYNTIICPSTDNREIETFGSKTLLELSINGLLVSSIASYIGLPDLFDTKTGLTAIGRFGLMDGQSIFTYGGAFLPEPSAWEKIKLYELLGIQFPGFYEIDLSDGLPKKVNLKARSKYQLGDTVILKVRISDDEYYLLENRIRDANKDGAIIDIYSNATNTTKQLIFTKDENGFQYYDIKNLEGVITNIDEFDWALPASGIAIWYIDEKVIREKFEKNEINADKKNKGIFLVEADGVYNIGYTYETPLGNVIGEGDEFDLWYNGNKAKLYKNIFNNNSKPPATTKDNLPTFIEFKDFSEAGPVMSFTIKSSNPIKLVRENVIPTAGQKINKIIYTDGNLSLLNSNDSIYFVYDGLIKGKFKFNNLLPAVTDSFIVLSDLSIYDKQANFIKKININKNVNSNIIISENFVFAGLDDGSIIKFNLQNDEYEIINIASKPVKQVLVANNDIYALDENNSLYKNSELIKTYSQNIKSIYFVDATKEIIAVSDNSIWINENINTITTTNLSFGDFDKSGNLSYIYQQGNQIIAKKFTGAITNNFPFYINDNFLSKRVLVVDYNKDGYADFITSSNNRVYIVNGKDNKASNFPVVAVGDTIKDFYLTENSLMIILKDNTLKLYQIENLKDYEIFCNGANVNIQNNKVLTSQNPVALQNEYFPKKLCYNWPNPVYDGITYLRYLVTEDSEITIRIASLDGNIVKKLNTIANANIENETMVDLSNLGAGVYYGSIEAKSKITGKKSTNIIKIAIVK